MSNFKWENEKYKNIHLSLKKLFWDFFTLFQSEKNDISNCMWIYNLEKNYTAKDFDKNYQKLVKNNLALESSEIIKNTFIDEKKNFLR
jgi:hypothetical protein